MAKQLNVNLAFTADTAKAKAELRDLQTQLSNLSATITKTSTFQLSDDLVKANQSVLQLKHNLEEAFNVNTGNLDLGKFQQSMRKNNMSLDQYKTQLEALGPAGQEAFSQVASAITRAEIPLKRTGLLFDELWTTMKNTARWQLSSSILHGIMGAVQHAAGYAQDLNKSLNNIRIVTGKSADDMARFAKDANSAAKSLSATTLDYTDASLIYYQQGLSDKEVKERADTTIKLANVSRESAEEVSQQMTAVWNNFDDGSKSLEYYADVLTALGATTASSTAEIATGLEKFAAVADTVGLSYEYAAAALATVTATTRQSADIVGTAFKTLFARIESLKLGDTLDDGTTLGKYSEALEQVGVDIKTASGELKQMDTILDETAVAWQGLEKDQKVALAQTVAGVRQYTQFIALMDNWDFMEQNIATANAAEGTLQKQAEIYAESWEAAQKRVSASAEAIYSQLINDKFFIKVLDDFSKFIDLISKTIDGLGGLKGVLLTLGTVFTTVFNKQLTTGLENTLYNLRMMTASGRKQVEQEREKANNLLIDTAANSADHPISGPAMSDAYRQQGEAQKAFIQNAEKLEGIQRLVAEDMLDQQQIMIQEVKLSAQQLEDAEKEVALLERQMKGATTGAATGGNFRVLREAQSAAKAEGIMAGAKKQISTSLYETTSPSSVKELKNWVDNLNRSLADSQASLQKAFGSQSQDALNKLTELLGHTNDKGEYTKTTLDEIDKAFNQFLASTEGTSNSEHLIELLAERFKALYKDEEEARAAAERYYQTNIKVGTASQDLAQKQSLLQQFTKKIATSFEEARTHTATYAESLVSTAQVLGSIGMAISSVNGLISTWDDESIPIGQKLITTLTTLGMVIPIVTKAISAQTLVNAGHTFGLKMEAMATALATEKTITFKMVMADLLWPLLGITAAITALIFAFNEIKNSTPEAKFKRISEATENAKNKAEETKAAYEDIVSAFDQYDTIIDKLETITEKTEEWNKTNLEAIEIIEDLVQKYPQLAGKIELDNQGRITNKEQIQTDLKNQSNQARVASLSSNIAKTNSSLDKQKTDLLDSFDDYHYYFDDVAEKLADGSVHSLDEAIAQIAEKEGLFEEQITLFTESVAKNKTEILDYADAIHDRNQSIKNTGILVANEVLSGDNYADNQRQAAAEQYGDIYQQYFDQYMQKGKDGINIWSGRNDEQLQALMTAYAEATGEELQLAWNAVIGTDSNRSFKLADGGEILLEEIANAIASSLAAKDLTNPDILPRAEGGHFKEDKTGGYTDTGFIENKQKELDVNDDLLDTYAELLQKRKSDNELIQKSETLARKLALRNIELNKGFKDLIDNWDEQYEILNANDKESAEYAETLTSVKVALSDVFGVDVSNDFVEEHLQDINDLATGDIEKLDALGMLAAQDYVAHMSIAEGDTNMEGVLTIEEARAKLESLVQWAIDTPIESRAEVDLNEYIDSLNHMLATGQITADQVNSILGSIGYAPDIGTTVTQKTVHHDYVETHYGDDGTSHKNTYSVDDTYDVEVPTINGVAQEKLSNRVDTSNRKGAGNNGKGKGSGGKSKTLKKADDEIDRYHVIKETIRDLTAEYDKANKAKERLFGADRVKMMNQEIAATDKLIDAQKQYISEIEGYLQSDEAGLTSGILAYTGVNADMQGGILQNYEEVMKAAIDKYNGDKSDNADDKYNAFKKLISQYEETFALLDDANAELVDLINRNQDIVYERLNYVVELKEKVTEADLKTIETSIDLLGDSVYKAAERLELLWNNTDKVKDKFDNLNDQFNDTSYQISQLNMLYDRGKISQEQWMEGLDKARDSLQKQLETLIDYDNEMRTYYSSTLSDASSEMKYWTDQLEHSTSVLSHYQKIVELSGHSEDYQMLGVLLKGQVMTRQNSYKVSAQWLESLKEQRKQIEEEISDAQRSGSYERVEWLRDKLQSIVEETNQAEEQMLSDFESYLDAVNADLENDIAKINHNAEMLASNGLGFDYIISDLDKLKTIQDEYLTKTNQVYETTKFLRQIQQDMDKTDNVASKEKLKNFQKMVEGLKEQGQLSQVELEIAKRRYEVELAQMALEDAKNAKSVVRLSRDSEGNYGYVYSADPNKTNDAEQALADKQNDLYNYALETYNNNITKLNELYKSQQDELNQLAEDYYKKGLMTEEEYNQKVYETKQRYHDQALIYLQNADETRNVLNEVALTDYSEAYASHYGEITTTVEEWDANTQQNFDNVDARYKEWAELVGDEVRPIVGDTLYDLKLKTNDVTTASNELTNTISTEVIPRLDEELQSVNDVTKAYELQRDAILATVAAIQAEIAAINQKYAAQAQAAETLSTSYDSSVDYSDLMNEAVKRGYSVNGSVISNLQAQREAKITGDKLDEDYYGTRGSEVMENLKTNAANGNLDNWQGKYSDDEIFKKTLAKVGIHFATGGYTGDFDDSEMGRLAWLHSKELVLNQEDTSNILSAVNLIREVAGLIDLQAMSAAVGSGALYSPTVRNTDSTLDQNVHIEASFPSVTDHNEIEEALNSLVNRAAQFANRK